MSVDVLAAGGGAPDALALVTADSALTYRQLGDAVAERAETLAGEGVAPGSVVPLVVEPDRAGVLSLLACWHLGAVPAPLNPRLTEAERMAALAALTGAPEGTHAIVWTSGTSGRPRGVALAFSSFEANARASVERLGLGAEDVWLASLSQAHVGGLVLLVRALLLGATVVAPGAFSVSRASALIDGGDLLEGTALAVTHLSLVPTQLARLLDDRRGAAAPDTLRCVLIGGAHAPSALVDRALRARWPVALTYGATEMGSQIATAPPARVRDEPGTVGRPLAGVEVEISGDGEILARGATMAMGYLVQGAAPGAAATPLADTSGWYRTGDLGRLDEHGELWITGRREDRIVTGGVTVDAVEVEEALRAHPAVLDACVVGAQDEEWGEVVAAWVEPVVGEFDHEEISRHLREVLSVPKLPRRWHVEGGLPRNANGKVDRSAVRAAFE